MDSQKKYVSASTMKSLEQCSWKYYTDKHLKVPEKNNDGARRGTICHALELIMTV
jgi:ATP-dependent helicase/DNAse subunit B